MLEQDFTRTGELYDVVFDAVAKVPPVLAHRALKKMGIYLNVHRDAHANPSGRGINELLTLKDLLEAGKFKPVIDRV